MSALRWLARVTFAYHLGVLAGHGLHHHFVTHTHGKEPRA